MRAPRRCGRIGALGLTALLVGLTAVPGASAQGVGLADASCPGPPSGTNTNNAPNTTTRFAQVFTAQASGVLTAAQLVIFKAGTPGDYRFDVAEVNHSRVPTNNVLATTSVSDAAVPAGQSIVAVGFDPAPPVVAGGDYALVVTRPGSNTLGIGVRTGDACPGALFESPDQTDLYFLSEPDLDLVYGIFVQPGPAAAPPDTAITNGPTDKTRKRKATFEFSSNVPGSTFQCSLDGAASEPCTSPTTYQKLKRRKHTFQVRATDPAGNTDPTEATDDWKIKKRR